jgi:ABC-type branched-subunit amino acid transport system substrate-binding protein
VYFTTHAWFGTGATPEARAFADAYTNAYGKPPANGFAALGYDATMIMQMDASQRAALELRLGRKPTRDEQVQSGQLAAVTAYVRMAIEATAHVLEPPEAARPA